MSLRARIFVTTLALALAVVGAVWLFSGRQISTTVVESVYSHEARAEIEPRRTALAASVARAYASGDRRRLDATVDDPANAGLTVLVVEHGRVTTTNVIALRGASAVVRSGTLEIHREGADQRTRMFVSADATAFARVEGTSHGQAAVVAVLPSGPVAFRPLVVDRLRHDFIVAGFVALLGSLIAAFALSGSIAGPVGRLTDAAAALERGERDVRVEVKGSDELSRLGLAFNAMSVALANAERLRRELVADIAHELRTPLNNLHVELEAIRDGLVTPSAARIDSLYEECDRLAALVEDLQELSLADAGALTIERQPIAVDDLVRSAVAAARVGLAAKDHSLDVSLANDLPMLYADGEKLRRVLVNVLRNAGRHGREHGKIVVTAARRDDAIAFAVADDGPGLPPADLEHVFERFYRVDKSRDRSTGGSGLGLAIARRLVEAHGGSITASNNSNGGATFAFSVPLAPNPAPTRRTQGS